MPQHDGQGLENQRRKPALRITWPLTIIKKCSNESALEYEPLANIKSMNHRISSAYQRKIALSTMGTGRYGLSCGRRTLALGSCHIKKCHKHECKKIE